MAETSLNFLVQVQNLAEYIDLRNEEPSWIPQWHINNPTAPIAFWEAFDASLVESTPLPRSSVSSVSKSMLKISAVLLDTVEAHTQTMKKSRFEDPQHEYADLIEECWDLAAHIQNIYGESSLFAFAATLKCYIKSNTATEVDYHGSEVVRDLTQYWALRKPGMLESKLGAATSTYNDKQVSESSRRYFGWYFREYGINRRFFTSAGGYYGLGPSCMEQGDVCAILFGADVPFILRPTEVKGIYRLVGEVYKHGVIYGEVVERGLYCLKSSGLGNASN